MEHGTNERKEQNTSCTIVPQPGNLNKHFLYPVRPKFIMADINHIIVVILSSFRNFNNYC